MPPLVPHPARSPHLKGFTLVEILTVIAIVGILAAILIPVAGNVQTKGASIRSTANLRQLGSAILLYASDNKQVFPYAAAQLKSANGSWAVLGSWDAFIAPYLGMTVANPNAPGRAITGPANQMKIFEHPRDSGMLSPQFEQHARRTYAMPTGSGAVSISVWSGIVGDADIPRPKRIPELPQPSQTILLTERPGYADNYVGRTGGAGINTPQDQLTHQPNLNGGANKFNYLFADGHVKLFAPKETIGTGSLSAPRGYWTVAPGD
jgi:prepilin-type N-terminal cleavage/methylation domain-containing protein/prepilin-type processing-associated H-X9-DG protein